MHIYKSTKHQKGVTIIELLVYIGLLSIFLIVLLDVFTSVLSSKLESQSTAAVSQDSRYILSKLNYDITNADSVTSPASFGSPSNSLVIVEGGSSYTYSLNGSDLELTTPAGTAKLNGNDTSVTGLSFTKLGNPSVNDNKPTIKISFTVKSQIEQPSGQEEQTIDTTIGLR